MSRITLRPTVILNELVVACVGFFVVVVCVWGVSPTARSVEQTWQVLGFSCVVSSGFSQKESPTRRPVWLSFFPSVFTSFPWIDLLDLVLSFDFFFSRLSTWLLIMHYCYCFPQLFGCSFGQSVVLVRDLVRGEVKNLPHTRSVTLSSSLECQTPTFSHRTWLSPFQPCSYTHSPAREFHECVF